MKAFLAAVVGVAVITGIAAGVLGSINTRVDEVPAVSSVRLK